MTVVPMALSMLRLLSGFTLAAHGAYDGISIWAAANWHRDGPPVDRAWTPAVTLMKPVRGVDQEAFANFASFCSQDYPTDRVQYLFGALDQDDPALDVVRRLQREFPHLDIRIVAGSDRSVDGYNLKVCNLAAMLSAARNDLLILCDSDMRARPDYIRRIVAPFNPDSQPQTSPAPNGAARKGGPQAQPVGLVTCPYRGFHPKSFAAALEALGIGADFMPSALVSRALEGVGFAFGSTIVLPRRVLEEMGGFGPLANELADDFRLGEGARRAGYRVVISDYIIDDVLGKESFGAMWARRLRWARTVRSCRPAGYAGSFVTHGTVLGLVFLATMGFHSVGWLGLGLVVAARILTALAITGRYTKDPNLVRFLPILPLSDLFNFALFVGSFCGSTITWRGERFRLLTGGKIVPLHVDTWTHTRPERSHPGDSEGGARQSGD